MSDICRDQVHYVYVTDLKDLEAEGGCLTVSVKKQPIVLFSYNSQIYALDNKCPHMGFPLSQGTLRDGILTCHWHHARFDLHNGGTFDQWAGDVMSYPVQIRNSKEVWVGITGPTQSVKSSTTATSITNEEGMLEIGLNRNISLTIAKAIIKLSAPSHRDLSSTSKSDTVYDGLIYSFRKGLEFGTKYKRSGWGVGLTIHTCMMSISAFCHDNNDKIHALYHGLSAVAQDCAAVPPRFIVTPLPKPWPDILTLKRWFRQFVESRNAIAAERCLVTAVSADADAAQLADMLFAAATDHRFIGGGHILDFSNKSLEALDLVGWNDKELVALVLSSLISGYADAERMEESSSWRYPIDLVAMLDTAFNELPNILAEGRVKRGKQIARIDQTNGETDKIDDEDLVDILLGDDPQSIVNALLDALANGRTGEEMAAIVAYAAAIRIAQFNTRNEFTDWDAALHTFTFANAVHQGMRRLSAAINLESQDPVYFRPHELIRGVFDGAMRVYLNRFLNIPPASIPNPNSSSGTVHDEKYDNIKEKLSMLLDKQQQVDFASQLVADYYDRFSTSNSSSELYLESQDFLVSLIASLLLREDRSFHLIQMIEAAFKQWLIADSELSSTPKHNTRKYHFILAAVRYLAAHSPTMRSQTHTYQTAVQLSLGHNLFE
jgi:nitrite reductase/ring-hydroxylating ferredoxin subunit